MISRWLKAQCNTSTGPYLLPFAPNPNWPTASVFVVGLNPIASFREEFGSFNSYWNAVTRCPESFEKIYEQKYLRQGKERSRTNARLKELVTMLVPLNVLVTNVFAYPTTNPLRIPRAITDRPLTDMILPRLLEHCKPQAVVFHGAQARRFGERYFGVKLDPKIEPHRQQVSAVAPYMEGRRTHLFAYHHFVGRVEPKVVVDIHLEQLAASIRRIV
jgi:hypothetical protein